MLPQNQRLNKLAERHLSKIEKICAYYRGKGWGAHTVASEVRQIFNLADQKKISLVVDIGGNKGSYTNAILETSPDIRVIIFEPSVTNLKILREEFTGRQVTIEPFALSSKNGTATLFFDKPGSGLASLTKRNLDHHSIDFSSSSTVQTLRFEDYWRDDLGRAEIDVCKIDVEGHELDVLSGFGEAMQHINLIQFEFGGTNIDTRVFFRDFWNFFTEHRFEIYRLTPFGHTKIKRYKEDLEVFLISNFVAKRC
ncbi:FkbM family methyltransferase [Roseibium sp. M-1]